MRTNLQTNDFMARAEEIFCAALEIASSQERAAYLQASCGSDAKLKAAVEGMLSSQPAVENFFKRSKPDVFHEISKVVSAVRSDPENSRELADVSECEGGQIGPYKLLQKIGEGGCGIFFMAEQQSPIFRRVALKVIKLGMDMVFGHCGLSAGVIIATTVSDLEPWSV